MSALETCQWHGVCRVDDIPARGARVLRRAGTDDIAVFRTGDGAVHAVIDRCPHKGGPLSAGLVHGSAVTCPLHGWVIDLESGRAQEPDEGCVPTVPVKVDDGMVYLGLETPGLETAD
jgi:nitrite reductase (NADH) small subunit